MKKHIIFYLVAILILIMVIPLFISKFYSYNPYSSIPNEFDSPTKKIEVKSIDEDSKQLEQKELFADYYDEAEAILSTLTTEEKLSQMFIVPFDYNGEIYNSVGGFLFHSSDIKNKTKESLIAKIAERQKNSKIPYIMTLDEEGGTVTRLSYNPLIVPQKILSPRDLYAEGGLDKLLEVEEYKDTLLLELGFNLNLAPVADISTNENDFMYDRSIGLTASETSNYISLITKKAHELNFSTCLKHFPGYGNNADTHTGIAIDNRSLEEFENNDFLPFKAGIEAQTPFILISHNIITNIDSNYPSSLSKKVIDILKNDLNYTGLIISDDLTMDALKDYNSNNELSTLAINAGNDLLITTRYQDHYNSALTAIKEGRISEERINESVKKIIAWKLAYNII